MSSPDPFGYKKELRILRAEVRNVFTPHRPIHRMDFFFGRETQVRRLIEQINTPGQHAILFGERGVGKSSLANISAELVLKEFIKGNKGNLYKFLCDSSTKFEDVLASPLMDAGIDINLIESTNRVTSSGRAGVTIPGLSAGVNSNRESTEKFKSFNSQMSASLTAKTLGNSRGLLIIDEADAIRDDITKQKLAELMKHLSDTNESFKILIVGIAETGEELIGHHRSIQRCLKEKKLDKMSDQEIESIVVNGSKKVGLKFEVAVINKIVNLSSGFPFFTHLIALKAAESAIDRDSKNIIEFDLEVALKTALQDADISLKSMYQNAIRSHNNDMYKNILCAASIIRDHEFTTARLRASLVAMGVFQRQTAINACLRRFVSNDNSSILRRKAKGIYSFNDPRLPIFVRMINSLD